MTTYTNISKPSQTSYTPANSMGKEGFDDPNVLFDDTSVYFDGTNVNQYTNVSKPSSTSYTNIAKPS